MARNGSTSGIDEPYRTHRAPQAPRVSHPRPEGLRSAERAHRASTSAKGTAPSRTSSPAPPRPRRWCSASHPGAGPPSRTPSTRLTISDARSSTRNGWWRAARLALVETSAPPAASASARATSLPARARRRWRHPRDPGCQAARGRQHERQGPGQNRATRRPRERVGERGHLVHLSEIAARSGSAFPSSRSSPPRGARSPAGRWRARPGLEGLRRVDDDPACAAGSLLPARRGP